MSSDGNKPSLGNEEEGLVEPQEELNWESKGY